MRADPSRFQNSQRTALRAHVVIRSRYAEDRLAEAVKRGVGQFVSLGAGFDTFAYRQPEWAKALRIFEMDQPGSQREKRDRLQKGGVAIPENVELVPIDFETTSLADGLRTSNFDALRPAFIAWLGVSMYLTQEAIDAVLGYVAGLPRSSEIVFTFSPPLPPEYAGDGDQPSLAERVAEIGEPWLTHITPEVLVAQLRRLGFSEIRLPTPEEIDRWYIKGRQDGLRASRRTTIASAVVYP